MTRDPFEPEKTPSDHFLGLDAEIVGTRQLRTARDNIAAIIRHQAMGCLFGPAGLGKTLSVNAALRELAPDNTLRLVGRSRPYPSDLRRVLYQRLHLPGEPPNKPSMVDTHIKPELSRSFRVLLVDEAQWMNQDCFEFFRNLWDEPDTKLAILFVGGEKAKTVLQAEPALASRIYIWQKFKTMTEQEVLNTIPAFHPTWEGVDEALIKFVNRLAGHGNFRMWASITVQVKDAMAEKGIPAPTEDLLRWVFAQKGLAE